VLQRDPRIRASDADLVAQAALANDIDALRLRVHAAAHAVSPAATHAQLVENERLLTELESAVESADTAPTANERATWATLRVRTLHALR
jgi:hypothetical protein